MSELLLITIGPVQEFIAQARRTRDLWFGSHLLSELSRAAARVLAESGAELIFPALLKDDPELLPSAGPLRPSAGASLSKSDKSEKEKEKEKEDLARGLPPLSIANRLLVEVPDGLMAADLAHRARAAVQQHWREITACVQHRCQGLLAPGLAVEAAWREQIKTFLEFAAAWAPLEPDGYDVTRRRIEGAVDRRKALRDFSRWSAQRGHVPKSSLDGGRETVLAPGRERDAVLKRRYRIADGEQLDSVGLVKRAGGEPDQFVPIANIALARWIEEAREAAPDLLQALENEGRRVGLGVIERPDLAWTRAFPLDAQVFLESRWPAILEEADYLATDRPGASDDARRWGRMHVTPVLREMAAPHPYVACLVADGDGMGEIIRDLKEADAHRTFSRELSRFAGQAREIVEQKHRGILVYSGGDDVLAFVCLPDAIACADDLQRAFLATMANALGAVGQERKIPTLSVGIGIGHLIESMGDLLELGRRAERRAKQPGKGEGSAKNALAVLIDKRSGGETMWRANWSEEPAKCLEEDVLRLEGNLSGKKVFEIASDLRRMPDPGLLDGGESRTWAELLKKEIERTLRRSEGGEPIELAELQLDLDSGDYATRRRRVERWVARMMVAKTLHEAEIALAPPQKKDV